MAAGLSYYVILTTLLVHCLYAAAVFDQSQLSGNIDSLHENKRQLEIKRNTFDAARVRALEQRVREDIARELHDVSTLEEQLARSLETIHEKKRQLEIKRSLTFGDLK